MRIYLAGPMSGIKDLNFPAFHAAAEKLRAIGYDVLNPAEIVEDQSIPWVECMRRDIAALVTCDTIVMLPGHEASRGATLERHIAEQLGMSVLLASDIP